MGEINNRALSIAIFAVVFIAAIVWWPAMYGHFYFDDWPNLSGLEEINDSRSFIAYVLNATSSFVGRPISYLSFALQSESWPGSPFDFKVVNLAIHLINGILVMGVGLYLLKMNGKSARKAQTLAVIVAGIWLVHPLHASAVPYVVQRMTLLSAFFSLLALLAYCYLRYEKKDWGLKEVTLISLAIALLSFLGVLSKENAILTGMFILAAEVVVKQRKPFGLFWPWIFSVSMLPVIAVFILLTFLGHFNQVESYRDFSVFERLLTQSRVVVDYLGSIVLPTPSAINIYNDSYDVSRGLLNPLSTLFSILVIALCSIFSFLLRKKFEWFAFGWLFFMVGHILESTILPLELYFEHRNYLPMLGVTFSFVIPLAGYFFSHKSFGRILILALGGCYVIYLVSVAFTESVSWSSSERFAVSAVSERPESLRARQEAANYFISVGDYDLSARLMFSLSEDMDKSPGVTLQLRIIQCLSPETLRVGDSEVAEVLRHGSHDKIAIQALHQLWQLVRVGDCKGTDMAAVRDYAEYLSGNPAYSPVSENLSLVHAFALADMEHFGEAANLMSGNVGRFGVEYGLLCARLFDASGDSDRALRTLESLEKEFSGRMKFEVAFRPLLEQIRSSIVGRSDELSSN